MQCFKWSIILLFFSLALQYSDQGICRLGAKLFAEVSFLWGIDWSFYSRCNVSNDQLVFFFALWYCDQGICQLGAKLFAEVSFLLSIDWSLTSSCTAHWLIKIYIFFFLTICYFGLDYILCVCKFSFILKYCILSTSFLGRTKAMKMCLVFGFFD